MKETFVFFLYTHIATEERSLDIWKPFYTYVGLILPQKLIQFFLYKIAYNSTGQFFLNVLNIQILGFISFWIIPTKKVDYDIV
jgi:hypothetical protein